MRQSLAAPLLSCVLLLPRLLPCLRLQTPLLVAPLRLNFHQPRSRSCPCPCLQDLAAYWAFNDPEQNGIYRETLAAHDSSGRGNHLPLVTLPAASRQTIEKVLPGGQSHKQDMRCPYAHCHHCWCCASTNLPAMLPSPCLTNLPCQQGGSKLEAGALSFRNNYAMAQGFAGMPDRWVGGWVGGYSCQNSGWVESMRLLRPAPLRPTLFSRVGGSIWESTSPHSPCAGPSPAAAMSGLQGCDCGVLGAHPRLLTQELQPGGQCGVLLICNLHP